MSTFISDVTREILAATDDLRRVALVVPGRRAGLFFKREIARQAARDTFLPEFLTVEDLAVRLSRIEKAESIPLLFEFYSVYLKTVPAGQAEAFDVFARWGQTLLADFNDIDRYMLSPDDVFATLQDVEHIENWNPGDPLSPLMAEHKNFWHLAERLYHALRERLLSQGKGYAGMVIRRAAENTARSAETATDDRMWAFAGFNAVSRAETVIMEYFCREKSARMFYDADRYYMDNPRHSAGTFLRRLRENAALGRDFRWTGDHLSGRKTLRLVGAPKKAAQAKAAGEILREMIAGGASTNDTALVLADESLLVPMLGSLPPQIPAINVTMGYPLAALPSAGFADGLLALYSTPERLRLKGFYHKDVVNLLRHGICAAWLSDREHNYADEICRKIVRYDIVDFRPEKLKMDFPDAIGRRLELLFGEKPKDPAAVCRRILEVVRRVRETEGVADDLTREYLFKLYGVFTQLSDYMERYPYVENLGTMAGFYRQLSGGEKLDFYGEPLEGLQLMGLLETRLLDFKNLIVTGVNEGVLPAGKTDNSFIPYDVKRHFALPTYSEKDAVYAYHFFRLLQRAEHITILYNTDTGDLGQVEPSRFLLQIKHDFRQRWDIEEQNLSFGAPALPPRVTSAPKSPFALRRIREILSEGISPSTLNMYLCNPMEFYYRKVLGVAERDEVEETAAANTMGTILHDALETLYGPAKGTPLTVERLDGMRKESDRVVREAFERHMADKDFSAGKNYLVFEAVKRMAANFIEAERAQVAAGAQIVVRELETGLSCEFSCPGLDIPVRLKGQADRIDTYNGTVRIIDYKSGRAEATELRLDTLEQIRASQVGADGKEELFTKPKALQVLLYAYMYDATKGLPGDFTAGVISLRQPANGMIGLNFTTEKARTYRYELNRDDLGGLREALARVFSGMLDPGVPFVEAGTVYYDI